MLGRMKFCPQCAADLRQSADDENDRLSCTREGCTYVFYNNPVPVVAAIIEYDEQVMLVHQPGWPPKMLGLVSGFLEADETPEEAIIREIKEETNLDTRTPEFIGHYAFVQQNQLILAYAAKCSGDIRLNEELDRYKLIDPDRLVAWDFGTGFAVRDWLAQRA